MLFRLRLDPFAFHDPFAFQDFNFSYAGACYASMPKNGDGQLCFRLGHEGAGIAVKTVMGDGNYPVFAEKYNDEIVRVYVNLV